MIDTFISNISYILTGYLINGTIINLTTIFTNATFSINYTDLENGNYSYYVTTSDKVGSTAGTSTITLYLDTRDPGISFGPLTDLNASIVGHNWIFIDTLINDSNPSNLTFSLYYANLSLRNESLVIINVSTSINFTNIADGAYFYNVTARDLVNHRNITELRKILLDTIAPSISFDTGTEINNSLARRNWIFINTTVSDLHFSSIIFSLYLNGTLLNQTNYTGNQNFTNFTLLGDGAYFYNVSAHDLASNINVTETRIITLDTRVPEIVAINPANNSAGIQIISNFTITFNENITMIDNNTVLVGSKGFNIASTLAFNEESQLIIVPNIQLSYNETYNLTMFLEISDKVNNSIAFNISFNFTTQNNPFNTSNSIIGNLTFVKTNIPDINITINGSDTYNYTKNESLNVIISNKTHKFVEVNISFSIVSFDLSNISIRNNPNSSVGSLIIRGIPLFDGINKSVYLDNVSDLQGVCIKDTDIININQITSSCKGANETYLKCPGTFKQYGCELNGSRYKITGLAHSGVIQQNDTAAPVVTELSISGSGSTITLSVTTDENATCKFDESDADFTSLSYSMTDTITSHTGTRSYSSSTSGTYYVRCNDTAGNVMSSSNTTSFSISISSGSGSSGGGGGGGGGGAATVNGSYICDYKWTCQDWSECRNGEQQRKCTLVKAKTMTTSKTPCNYDLIIPERKQNCNEASQIENREVAKESCSDGIKNQDEEGVDCGGLCKQCGKAEIASGEEKLADQVTGAVVAEPLAQYTKKKGIIPIIGFALLTGFIAVYLYLRKIKLRIKSKRRKK